MLAQVDSRRISLGLSVRQLAKQLDCSPSLISLVLNRKREPSRSLIPKLRHWLKSPATNLPEHHPSTLVRLFIRNRQGHLAASTMLFYQHKLSPFARWCELNGVSDIREFGSSEASAYFSEIRKGRNGPRNAGGLKLHHQTLKTFMHFIAESCELPTGWKNPCVGIKVKPSQAQTMEYSDQELRRIFEVIDNRDDHLLRARNRALVVVMLNAGLRIAELLAMNCYDLSAAGLVKVVGKGSKQRVVTVGLEGMTAIENYLQIRGGQSGALWQTSSGQRLSEFGLRSCLKRIEKVDRRAFSGGVYAHRFRHTAITRLLRARVPLRSVQRYAGHSDPQTTLRYAQALDADEAIDAVDRMSAFVQANQGYSTAIRSVGQSDTKLTFSE